MAAGIGYGCSANAQQRIDRLWYRKTPDSFGSWCELIAAVGAGVGFLLIQQPLSFVVYWLKIRGRDAVF